MTLDADWATYRASGDLAARNRIVEHYLPMVTRVAERLETFLARHADHDDLVSYGTFGLIDAVTKYDPATSTNFEGYAWKRIKGAMVDDLRRHDQVRRTLRGRGRQIETARTELAGTLGRWPTDAEAAEWLGMTEARLVQHLGDLVAAAPAAPLSAYVGELTDLTVADSLQAPDDVEEAHAIEELREVVVAAWNALPTRERTMLTLRYVEGLTLTAVGTLFGLKATRVSQLHDDAIRMLRTGISRL